MKYVFRALKRNIFEKTKKIDGVVYYEFPIVVRDQEKKESTYHVYVNKAKTYTMGDSLYIVLDSDNFGGLNYLKEDTTKALTDSKLLKILTNDYISYMVSKEYTDKSSHAINNLMPVGIQERNIDTNATRVVKWTDTCKKIQETYGNELVCVEPFVTDFLYPFHYSKFQEGKFPREYLSNMMMFLLTIDPNFEFTTEKRFDNECYIYYKLKDRNFPFFRMITNEQFYESCLVKDVKNFKKTPFLKRFNDHGMTRELIQFMKEDDVYRSTVVAKYKALRDEMKLESNDKERIFIPSLSKDALFILKKMKLGEKLTRKEQELYKKAYDERIVALCNDFYEKDLKFFFTYDELDETNLTITTASKKFIDMPFTSIEYDETNRVVYAQFEHSEKFIPETPILQVITKKELDEIKEDIYRYWISTKHYKR